MASTAVYAFAEYDLYSSIIRNVQNRRPETPALVNLILRKVGTYVTCNTIVIADNVFESEVNPIDNFIALLQFVFGSPVCGTWSSAIFSKDVQKVECISRVSAQDILEDLNLQKKGQINGATCNKECD